MYGGQDLWGYDGFKEAFASCGAARRQFIIINEKSPPHDHVDMVVRGAFVLHAHVVALEPRLLAWSVCMGLYSIIYYYMKIYFDGGRLWDKNN